MKRLVVVLALLTILVGCSTQTKTVNNLEYVTHIQTRHDDVVQFKDTVGNLHLFYLQHGSPVLLDQSKKYNVTITIDDFFTYGDFIEGIEEIK